MHLEMYVRVFRDSKDQRTWKKDNIVKGEIQRECGLWSGYGVELEYKVGCTLCKAVKPIKDILSLYAKSSGKSLMCYKQGNDKIINNKYHFFVIYKTYWRKVKRDFLAYRLFQHFRQEAQLLWCR